MYIPADLWFRAFVLTVLVEAPIVAAALRSREPSWARLLVLIVFANLASHPAVWFVFTQLLLVGTLEYTVVVEGWAIACEALFFWAVFRGLPARWALVIALVANITSFLVGRLLFGFAPDLF